MFSRIFSQKSLLLILVLVGIIAAAVFLGSSERASTEPPSAETAEAEAAAPSPEAPAKPAPTKTAEAGAPERSALKAHTEGEECAHCEAEPKQKSSDPLLLTNPANDSIFKKLASLEAPTVSRDVFDFLEGAQVGQRASFEVAGETFTGTVSLSVEEHPVAKTYGMNLEAPEARLLVTTDAHGAMVAEVFFVNDSRILLMEDDDSKVETAAGPTPPQLGVEQASVADRICGPSDMVFTGSGFRSVSGASILAEPAGSKEYAPLSGEVAVVPLESSPGADFVVYLDFGGELVSGTAWNTAGEITAQPHPRADNSQFVTAVWERVVEDFAPFNLNITTDRAVFEQAASTERLQVIITPTDDAAPGAGGVAFLDSFRTVSPIVWVFNLEEYACASTISHEAGHSFGLSHDGKGSLVEYYFGHNSTYTPGWGPIMGAPFGDGFYDEVDQWSKGEYSGADNQEDDIAIIGNDDNGFGFVEDDFGDTFDGGNTGSFTVSGTNVVTASGLISTSSDIDVFQFSVNEGEIRFRVSPTDVESIFSEIGSETSGANLAVDAKLLDNTGAVVAEGVPDGPNQLGSVIEHSVTAGGIYFISVEGGGRGDADGGFTDYASLGAYSIRGELALPPLLVLGPGPGKQDRPIFNTAATISTDDGTDFGFNTTSGVITRDFLLENTSSSVNISNLSVSLDSGAHFSISAQPMASIIPGGFAEVSIDYEPTTIGPHFDTVIVSYDFAGRSETFEFVVGGMATVNADEDNYEDNDVSTNAYDLSAHENVWLSDHLGYGFFLSDPTDFYSFQIEPGDDLITVSTANIGGGNIEFEVFYLSAGNNPISVFSSSAINDELRFLLPDDLNADRFYVQVKTFDDASKRNAYDLKWTAIDFVVGGEDLYEDNNSMDTAYVLRNQGLLSEEAGLGVSNDDDWYKITIPEDPFARMLRVEAIFNHDEGDIDIQLYREGVLRGFSNSETDNESIVDSSQVDFDDFAEPFTFEPQGNNIVLGVEPGVYHVLVTGDHAGNTYDLRIETERDDAYEEIAPGVENDVQGNAYDLGEAIIGQQLSQIDGPGVVAAYPENATEEAFISEPDQDWFVFDLPSGEVVESVILTYESIAGGLTSLLSFAIFDESGALLASTDDGSPDPGELIVASPATERLWIRVGTQGPITYLTGYDFQVNVSSEPPFIENPIEDNYEENDTYLELYNISSNEGRWLSGLDGYGTQLDADWYQITIPSGVSRVEATLFHIAEDGDMDLTLSTKEGPKHFVANEGGNTETIIWDDPIAGDYALTVTGQNKGNFYNLFWDLVYTEDNFEENDTRLEAFDLRSNERRFLSKELTQGGGKGIQRDADWYRISAEADTVELRANLTFKHIEGDIDLALYNDAGAMIRRSVSSTDNESVSFPNPAEGDYFLKVHFGDAGNEYDLAWTALSQTELDDIATGDDPYEENDQIENAYPLTSDNPRLSSYQGLGIQKDEDWYEIEIPENNIGLRIECLFDDALGDIDFELYDPFGFPVAVRDSLTDNEILDIDTPLPGGTYQIRVFGPNLGNTYDLYFNVFADDVYEENDVIGDATDISLFLGDSLPDGPLVQGDDDWYRFEVTGSRAFIEVSLEYQEINGAVDFRVLDPNENVITTATSTDDSETVFLPVQSGTHYVHVFGDNFFNDYDLVVTQFGDDSYEENDVAADAKTIPPETGIELAQFDDDWFKFEISEENSFFTVTAAFTHDEGNVDLELFEEADLSTPIASSMTTQNTESVQVSGAPGTYFIKITGDDINPDYVLSWSTAEDDAYEENDTFGTARDIRPEKDTEIVDLVQFDEDWYRVESQPGEMRLIVDLKYERELGNINIALFDSSENELLLVDTDADNETLIHTLDPFAPAQDFFIKVSGDNSGNGYSLEWTTSIEDNFEGDTGNNLYEEPSKALLESEGIAISKTIGYGALLDEDWYEVRINPGDNFLVIETLFNQSEGDIDLELFDTNESFLARSVGASDQEKIHFRGAPGTYYLRVFSELNQNAYDLYWNSFREDDLELGAAYNSGSAISSNDSPATARNLERASVNLNRGGLDLENALLDNLTLYDEDWYEVAVYTEEDLLRVQVDFEHDLGDIDVALYRHDQVYPDPFRPPLLARPLLPHPVLPLGAKNLVLVEESVSLDDNESILIPNPDVGIYYIVVYGYGLSNPKVPSPWGGAGDSDYSYDHVTKDYVSVRGRQDTALWPPDLPDPNPSYNPADYDISEPGSGLGNVYSLRWSSVGDDTYDKDTPAGVNDSFDLPAEPILLPPVAGNVMVNQQTNSSETNCEGDPVIVFSRPIYRFGLAPDLPLVLLDDDWYSFTVGGDPHFFRAQIDFENYQGNLDMSLYRKESDGSITLVDQSTSERGIEVVVAEGSGQAETTYLIKVEGVDKIDGNDVGNEYSLEVRPFADDDFEQNDSIEEANENENADISDLCGINLTAVLQDEDYYRIDIPKDQVHLEIEFSSVTETSEDSNVNFNIEILDDQGEPLPDGFDVSGRSNGIETYRFGVISPEAKTYYLKISEGQDLDPADYSGVSYTFRWAVDNVDQYDLRPTGLIGLYGPDNDSPAQATDLTRLRLEPIYDPKGTVLDPVDEFRFDYELLSDPVVWDGQIGVFDGFGHAIQEADGDDWYVFKIPSWKLVNIPNPVNEEALKRLYFTRLFVEIDFEHDDGDIDMEIYDDTSDLSFYDPLSPNFQVGSPPQPLAASSKSVASDGTRDMESFFARIGPQEEGREYFIRVFRNYSPAEIADPSIRTENHYNLKWEVFAEDAYERLTDGDGTNDTNNFVDRAFDLTEVNGDSTEDTWLHEIEFPQDRNGDGVIDAADGGSTSPLGYGMQRADDWYAIVVSPGSTDLEVIVRSYSDNDTGFDPTYTPDDLDIDFEVYFLAGDDGDPATFEQRKPVLVGRSTEPTDLTLFESAGLNSEDLIEDITREIEESATFDLSSTGPGIYFIRIYHDNRSHPYTFYWNDIGGDDNSSDSAIVDNYVNGNWTFQLPDNLPSVPLPSPHEDPDGDSLPNWAEQALGLDPAVSDYAVIGQSIAEIEVDGETGQYYQFEFLRNVEAEALGYEFIVQESDDLNFGAAEAVHVRNEPVPGSLELERVIYRGSKPISEQNQCFFRLKLNEPPASK